MSRFELEGVVALPDVVVSSNVSGIKGTWFLESITMLEDGTVQFCELNSDLNIAVDALGKFF